MRSKVSKNIKKYADHFQKKYGTHYYIKRKVASRKSGMKIMQDIFLQHDPFRNAILNPLIIPENIVLDGSLKITSRDLVKVNHYEKLKEYFKRYREEKFIGEYMRWLKSNYLYICDMLPHAIDKSGRIDPKRL